MPPVSSFPPPSKGIFDDDDEGWQDMPIIREDTFLSGMDEDDQKKYHYQPTPTKSKTAVNATGNLIDFDDLGNEWRSKLDRDESDYTRLRVNEEDDMDEVHLRTRYLFDEDKAMTPLSQMQATKNLLTEAQRIAYVGLCALTSREMVRNLTTVKRKELKAAVPNMELWALKIMGRLYYHMELEIQEQRMIESLAEHGVIASDLVPPLMTTHTVANPEYDPEEAHRKEIDMQDRIPDTPDHDEDDISISDQTLVNEPVSLPDSPTERTPSPSKDPSGTDAVSTENPPADPVHSTIKQVPITTKVLKDASAALMPGVSTSLSSADENVTLDIRWTILCDLFLVLIADSVYDARSRVLLEQVAYKLGLGWLDVVKFESRITEALEIQEDVETLQNQDIVEVVRKAGKKRRYVMLGLATLGGGLVIGLSAGLLAPVIGLGLAGALTTVGVTGTGAFLGGAAGAAVITTGGVLTGSGIAVHGMSKRTQQVRTFDILPLHNNKRVNCILTVPGFMNGANDDVRLPFSVLDPIVGDVFSVLWEPEMIQETGSALKILTGEVLSQIGLTVLQATIMTGLLSALQWPIVLTKLGYLIDNPWNNALDRARCAGRVLADVLIQRHLGVRPITLIGFSLGARVIFYALVELAKQKQFGIVQDVFLLGATLTVSQNLWYETRSVVSGRYVNAYAKNDWVLNYLFRATSGGVGTVAGLRPIEGVDGLENVDVTDKISGHMSYRTFMPLILDQLGFPVFADYFDEPEDPDFTEERIVAKEEEQRKNSGWFSRKKTDSLTSKPVSRPPSANPFSTWKKDKKEKSVVDDDDIPPRLENAKSSPKPGSIPLPISGRSTPTPQPPAPALPNIPVHAGFDLNAIKEVLKEVEQESDTEAGPSAQAAAAAAPMTLQKPTPSNLIPSQFLQRAHSAPDSPVPESSSHQRSSSLDGFATVPPDLDRGPRTAGFTPTNNEHSINSSSLNESRPTLSGDTLSHWEGSSHHPFSTPTTAKPPTTSFSASSSLSPSPPPPPSINPNMAFSNPFASPGHDRTPVLSFGVAGELDGKASNQAKSASTSGVAKKPSALDAAVLGSNPWS